jgi:hypothetical protein
MEVFRDFSHPDPVPEELRKEIQEQSDTAKMLYSMAQIKIPDLIRTT